MGAAVEDVVNPAKATVGMLILALTLMLISRDTWSFLPVGRTCGAMLGACLMVACRIITPESAKAAIDLETLAVLLGISGMVYYLEREGLFELAARPLLRGCRTPLSLLLCISAVSTISSALFMNDPTCLFLTPLVVQVVTSRGLPYAPFLIAVSTSANIGAALTPVGSPQNMIIASWGKPSFMDFFVPMLPAAALAWIINNVMTVFWFRKQLFEPGAMRLSTEKVSLAPALGSFSRCAGEAEAAAAEAAALGEAAPGRGGATPSAAAPAPELLGAPEPGDTDAAAAALAEVAEAAAKTAVEIADVAAAGDNAAAVADVAAVALADVAAKAEEAATALADVVVAVDVEAALGKRPVSERSRWRLLAFTGIAVLVLAAFVADLPLGFVCVSGVALMVVIDRRPPDGLLASVDGTLLLFFSSLFIVMHGVSETGLPGWAWEKIMVDANGGAADLSKVGTLVTFALVVLIGSNTMSNVPLVLLLAPNMGIFGREVRLGWLILSWVSTIAGNLTLVGSIANLIVAEKAKTHYQLRFWEFTRVGAPCTLAALPLTLPLLALAAGAFE